MPTNDFIGFASSGSANVASQADYAAAAEQGIGMQPGPASSKLANKAWRQGANMASALGGLIADQGYDALDNGDIATLKNTLITLLLPEKSTWTPTIYGGTTAGDIVITNNGSYYRKFGDLVFVRLYFNYKINSSPTGEVRIGGIPYLPDFYYVGELATNANAGIILNLTTGGYARPASYNVTSGTRVSCQWGATASATVWENGVNKTDLVLGQVWYRTSA